MNIDWPSIVIGFGGGVFVTSTGWWALIRFNLLADVQRIIK